MSRRLKKAEEGVCSRSVGFWTFELGSLWRILGSLDRMEEGFVCWLVLRMAGAFSVVGCGKYRRMLWLRRRCWNECLDGESQLGFGFLKHRK